MVREGGRSLAPASSIARAKTKKARLVKLPAAARWFARLPRVGSAQRPGSRSLPAPSTAEVQALPTVASAASTQASRRFFLSRLVHREARDRAKDRLSV